MKKYILLLLISICYQIGYAQDGVIKGFSNSIAIDTEILGVIKGFSNAIAIDTEILGVIKGFSNAIAIDTEILGVIKGFSNAIALDTEIVGVIKGFSNAIGIATLDAAITWNGVSWSNGMGTTATDNAVINGNYDTNTYGDITAKGLNVNSDFTVTVGAGGFIEVNNDLTHNGTDFMVASGGSLVTKGNVSGANFTFERTTTFDSNTGRYSIAGAPVSGADFSVLGASSVVYGYDETQAYNVGGNVGLDRFRTPAQLTQTELQVGQGYFSAFTGDANGKIIFTGTPNNGTQSVALNLTDHPIAEDAFEGFNLVANPYPCAIDLGLFITENSSDITGSVYLWDDFDSENTRGTNADYVVVNGLGVVNPSDRSNDAKWDGIHSMQGFFVQSIGGDNILDFTDAMKVTGNNTDAGFYRTTNEQVSFKIILESDEGDYAETLIGMREDATWELDQFDARLFNHSGMKIYSQINGEAYVIQGLPQSSDVSIPLGILSEQENNYTISIAEDENLQDYKVILTDYLLETSVELSAGEQYSYSASAGQSNDRFSIQMVNTITSVKDDNKSTSVVVYQNAENSLSIRSNDSEKVLSATIISLTGQRQVLQLQQLNSQEWRSNQLSLNGLYIISVITNKSKQTQRVILK